MFEIGMTVRYSQHGVCRMEGKEILNHTGKEMEYYVLTPLQKEGSTLYVPLERADMVAKILKLLTPEEVESMVAEIKETETVWEKDFRRRSDAAKRVLNSSDRKDALLLIKTVYDHKREEGALKRLQTTDDYFLKEAENLIFFEFATVLGKSFEDVKREIRALFDFEE